MAARKSWKIRAFTRDDRVGLQKLWAGLASFDGSVPARTATELEALLAHPAHRGGARWHVAVAGNGAIVGAIEVGFVGSVRTSLLFGVNPAWRRQGVGRALLEQAPQERRLLVTSRASVGGAAELLTSAGFSERYREARMRRPAQGLEPLPLPEGTRLDVDATGDVPRLLAVLHGVFGEDAEQDAGLLGSFFSRAHFRVIYLKRRDEDVGVCVVSGSERAKKSERSPDGTPTVGVVHEVGLVRSMRGRGLSRPLVRAGLVELARCGFKDIEVSADRRRDSAVELYEAEGFQVVDEDVHWLRREPGGKN